MAVIRKMRIVNPHKKHRRRKNKKAAARTTHHVRRQKRSARPKRSRRHKRNPLGSEVLLMTNGKKRKRRSRRRTHKSNPHVSRRRHKRNPFLKRSRRHSSRNPHVAGIDLMSVAKLGGGAAVGSIATRGLTQMALGDKNTGYAGYGANIAVALGLSWLAKKFVGKEVATGVAAGGIAAVILRYYTENVSQTSPNLSSGMGDLEFAGLGQYLPIDYSNVPFEQGGKFQLPNGAPAGQPAIVSGGGRFRSGRFAS